MMYDLRNCDFLSIQNNFEHCKDVESALMYKVDCGNPDISIMIPTYKRNGFLGRTIESILNSKTNFNVEVSVVDNNDDFADLSTLELIKGYGSVSYYKNRQNLGMFGNWNRCIELAKAKWILILHDDDTIEPDYIETMLKEAKSNDEISCIGCAHTIIDEYDHIMADKQSMFREIAKKLLTREFYNIYEKDFFYTHPINIMGLLLNKEKAIECGGFDNRWFPTSDYVFILNMSHRYKVKMCSRNLFNYRVAVNASLTYKHVVGMVEVDAQMRRCLLNSIDEKISKRKNIYFSSIVFDSEQNIVNDWGSKLSYKEKEDIKNEFKEFNSQMDLMEVSENDVIKYRSYKKMYNRFIRYIRL